MHHMPCILESVSFSEIVVSSRAMAKSVRIERCTPFAVRILSANHSGRRIENVLPIIRPAAESHGIFLAAETCRHLAGAPVVVGAFERARNRFTFHEIERIISVAVVYIPIFLYAIVLLRQCILDLPVRLGGIERNSLQICIDDDGDRMCTDHAHGIHSPQRPYRQKTGDSPLLQHRRKHLRNLVRHKNRVERMGSAKSIPTRKRGIERSFAGIGHIVRLDAKMIERRVPVALLILASLDLRQSKNRIPRCLCARAHALEIPTGDFSRKISSGGSHIFTGERHFHQKSFARLQVETENVAISLLGRMAFRQFFKIREWPAKLHLACGGAICPAECAPHAAKSGIAVQLE